MQCRFCETTNPDDNAFCEGCGTRMGGPVSLADSCACGAPLSEMDSDGFCSGCGRRLKRPDSDHIEIELLHDFAGVSDRGLRHDRNDDRFAIARAGNNCALVVCDGVSMSPDADEAAASAVKATLDAISEGLAEPEIVAVELLRSAIQRAGEAVTELGKRRPESPSTTLVAALLVGNQLSIGWIGDSRGYWLNGNEARQLTCDHSWQNSAAAQQAGAEAQKAANAHALTRWVGADALDLQPEMMQQEVKSGGLLLLCSDGLWNYTTDTKDMAALVSGANNPGASALEISRELVEFARNKGGHDNITAVVLRYPVSEDHSHGG
jgi:serine/threonine protein phosphatase PrpC